MALVVLKDIRISFGGDPVLAGVAFQLEAGQRVCLLGRNGEGKTTLLKIMSGEIVPDSGTLTTLPDVTVARLPQEVAETIDGTVFEVVANGAGALGHAIADYHRAVTAATTGNRAGLNELAKAQHRLEAVGAWDLNNRVETVLTQVGLKADAEVSSLSGGMKRRVLLARALVAQPDILLLDEPTNHLDLQSIRWLEAFLLRFRGTLCFVTHDRAFLRALANRILELDRGNIYDWACDYETFLKRKNQLLDDERIQNRRADRMLSKEETWIRQGIKARRTRNEGRVRRLIEMRKARQLRRGVSRAARVVVQDASRSGDIVVRAENVSFSYGSTQVIRGLDTVIERGDRVAIIGPNGCGKTTLVRLLLGQLEPTLGTVRRGAKVQFVYFDQLRTVLDPSATVFDTVNEGKDKVLINGHWRHVYSYLQDFLFAPDRARSPVIQLSGGERNRLMLAKLLTKPANLLVMDEPTNDLDVETLELLEEKLLNFSGTVLLVSHDRAFINNVATSTLVFEGGDVREYVGGYDDWLAQSAGAKPPHPVAPTRSKCPPNSNRKLPKTGPPQLKYREKRELEQIPAKIDDLETEQKRLYEVLGDVATYKNENSDIADLQKQLTSLETELDALYERWEQLEELNSATG